MDGKNRKDVKTGLTVDVVLKPDQRTGKRTRGVVREILTKSTFHPHGIKVRLESGEVGRVQEIIEATQS
ncbi:MAG: YwbE family protein [Blastocatellia bacterium]|nr:YwbE family protein [Blastocatellia bacterium]